jgi:hypothetical protein
MRLKMIGFAVAAFCLLAVPSFAADIDGTWVAEMPAFGGGPGEGGPGGGQQGPREITFNLKADGANLTGTVTSPRGENEIVDGKNEGDKVSFAVKRPGFQGNEITIKYEGSVSGDELTLKMSFEGMGGGMGRGPGGGGMEIPPLVAKRQK